MSATEPDDERVDLESAAIAVVLAFRDLPDATQLPVALTMALLDLDEAVAAMSLVVAPNQSRRGT